MSSISSFCAGDPCTWTYGFNSAEDPIDAGTWAQVQYHTTPQDNIASDGTHAFITSTAGVSALASLAYHTTDACGGTQEVRLDSLTHTAGADGYFMILLACNDRLNVSSGAHDGYWLSYTIANGHTVGRVEMWRQDNGGWNSLGSSGDSSSYKDETGVYGRINNAGSNNIRIESDDGTPSVQATDSTYYGNLIWGFGIQANVPGAGTNKRAVGNLVHTETTTI